MEELPYFFLIIDILTKNSELFVFNRVIKKFREILQQR